MNNEALTLQFTPILPDIWLYALLAAALPAFLAGALFYRRGLFWRTLCAAGFLLVFLNPSLAVEERRPVADVVAIIADRSASQNFGERMQRTDAALTSLEKALSSFEGLEIRMIESPAGAGAATDETRLFDSLDRALEDVPQDRRAGAIFITDGRIHDIPQDSARYKDYGPVHVLLTGAKSERDRRIVITEAPAYGIVGQSVTIRYRIEDTGAEEKRAGGKAFASLSVRINDKPASTDSIPVGAEQTLSVTIDHAGQNVADLQVAPLDGGELTQINNRAPVVINGVRDRLRVLLVSGQPHAGGRTWRNLLTADPGVDLVHFTILREPDKLDATPQDELSLIAFPFRELFETKLREFDLIIFDRYSLNRILPDYYFANIARYVREGGALLEASGPSFAGMDSIYTTALKDVLPAYPTGEIVEKSFIPQITATGLRHPVTQNLTWKGGDGNAERPAWGSWLRQIGVQPLSGEILMAGADSKPLLILDRVGQGRVAQLASDQIWLWSRGYEGGGPQAELLRRLAHWLMKEPALEENALDVRTNGDTILIGRRALKDAPLDVILTAPDGARKKISLSPRGENMLEASVPAEQPGIYTVDDGIRKGFAIVGNPDAPEWQAVTTTEERIAPMVEASKGGIRWLADDPSLSFRLLPPGRDYADARSLALRKNGSHAVTGVKDRPLLPAWVCALALLALSIAAWWFEGHGRNGKT